MAPGAPCVLKEEQALYLVTIVLQGLEGKEGTGEMLQVTGWDGLARQGIVQEGKTPQANAQGATQLGLGRGDARYLDVSP